MSQAVFITGYNNWGKSTIIRHLFNRRHKYYYDTTYNIPECSFETLFTVETHSNDDYWGQHWIDALSKRINLSPDRGKNLLTALCPTMESNNNFVELLNNEIFRPYQRLNILLLECKWEHHAKLICDNIIQSGQSIPRANFVVINADQNENNHDEIRNLKLTQIQNTLNNLF